MCLFDALSGKPFSQNIGHPLWGEGNRERELGIIPRHSSNVLVGDMNKLPPSELNIRTRSFGMSTSIGLSGKPMTEAISRILSDL